MTQVFSICLAVNLMYSQAAVTHPDAWFGIDKIKHFFISAFIESLSYSALQAARVHYRSAMAGGIGIGSAASIVRLIDARFVVWRPCRSNHGRPASFAYHDRYFDWKSGLSGRARKT